MYGGGDKLFLEPSRRRTFRRPVVHIMCVLMRTRHLSIASVRNAHPKRVNSQTATIKTVFVVITALSTNLFRTSGMFRSVRIVLLSVSDE